MSDIQTYNSSYTGHSIHIAEGWKLYRWKDLMLSYEQGLIRSNAELSDKGIFYFKMNNISNDGFDDLTKKAYTIASDEEFKRYRLQNGDFLINVRNSFDLVGKTCVVSNLDEEAVYNHMLIKITHVDARLNYYINALSRTPWKKYIEGCRKGTTTVIALYKDDLENIPIPIPPESLFQSIVSFEMNIINLIDNRASICRYLESMAKLLYDYWFVQFDFPDENGKPYKSSGGKMVWNEDLKREIPEGWKVVSLQNCINSDKNGDWGNKTPKKCDDLKVRCFRGADFASITSNYQTTAPVRYISKKNSDKLLSEGDLVVEISGGSPTQATGRIGYINAKFLERCGGIMVCSNFCKAFTPKTKTQQYWLYQTWKMYYDAGLMFNFEGKTTGIKNLLFESFVKDIKMPLPPETLLLKYQMIVSVYYDKIQECFMESLSLAELRDFLLPMLMNGQVKVGDNLEQNEGVIPFKDNYEQKFELWLENQGLAARGTVSRKTLRAIFDAMDDDDK